MSSGDERQLMDGLVAGDAEAFATLYDRYAHRVLGFALRLESNHSDAEDLVQEVFIAAYAGRRQFQRRSKLLTWLLGITWRRWRDRGRRHGLETVSLSEGSGEPQKRGREADFSLVDRGLGPEGLTLNSLTVNSALDQLESIFREAVLLVVSQGLTYKEAAEVLGEPVGTVKWRVSRSMHRLADILNAVEEEFHEMQERSQQPCPIIGVE